MHVALDSQMKVECQLTEGISGILAVIEQGQGVFSMK